MVCYFCAKIILFSIMLTSKSVPIACRCTSELLVNQPMQQIRFGSNDAIFTLCTKKHAILVNNAAFSKTFNVLYYSRRDDIGPIHHRDRPGSSQGSPHCNHIIGRLGAPKVKSSKSYHLHRNVVTYPPRPVSLHRRFACARRFAYRRVEARVKHKHQ